MSNRLKKLDVMETQRECWESLHKIFTDLDLTEIDENGDNRIELDELKNYIKTNNLSVPIYLSENIFYTIDNDRNGFISPIEYLKWKTSVTVDEIGVLTEIIAPKDADESDINNTDINNLLDDHDINDNSDIDQSFDEDDLFDIVKIMDESGEKRYLKDKAHDGLQMLSTVLSKKKKKFGIGNLFGMGNGGTNMLMGNEINKQDSNELMTYQRLIYMGFDEDISWQFSQKYNGNLNKCIDELSKMDDKKTNEAIVNVNVKNKKSNMWKAPMEIIKQGWLKKKGKNLGQWKERFVVLTDLNLFIYHTKDGTKKIKLSTISVSSFTNEQFRVSGRDMNYLFKAPTECGKQQWIDNISKYTNTKYTSPKPPKHKPPPLPLKKKVRSNTANNMRMKPKASIDNNEYYCISLKSQLQSKEVEIINKDKTIKRLLQQNRDLISSKEDLLKNYNDSIEELVNKWTTDTQTDDNRTILMIQQLNKTIKTNTGLFNKKIKQNKNDIKDLTKSNEKIKYDLEETKEIFNNRMDNMEQIISDRHKEQNEINNKINMSIASSEMLQLQQKIMKICKDNEYNELFYKTIAKKK
eukprot:523411_1